VRDRGEHEERWLRSLAPYSAYTQAESRPDSDPQALDCRALDAAVGVGLAAERLQRSFLGDGWPARTRALDRQSRALEFPLTPPPGCAPEPWRAIRAVMMADEDAKELKDLARVLPDEVELLTALWREDRAAYDRLAEAADAIGCQIDRRTRPDVLVRHEELTDGQAFRDAWVALFGTHHTRPSVRNHLAVHILDAAGLGSRDIALFLNHVGFFQAAVTGSGEQARQASLLVLDNEVYNARQALRRVREARERRRLEEERKAQVEGRSRRDPSAEYGAPDVGTPDALIRTIEWVTFAGLRRLPPSRPLPPPPEVDS